MAQKTGNEEPEYKVVPDTTISLCVKCGISSNSAAGNLCQSCFNAASSASTSAAHHVSVEKLFTSSRSSPEGASTRRDLKELDEATPPPVRREVNRCSGCRRKVGLTGYMCRCGELFCADHRYSDRHNCRYDYKAAGREAIARENPVVKAAKIVKI